jgi:hypothetical protein
MALAAHYRAAFSTPADIIFMAACTLFVKRHQQGYRDIFVKLLFVATGTFTPFTFVSIGEDNKIVVANSAA